LQSPRTLVPLYTRFNRRLLLPSITVVLSFAVLRDDGYRRVNFDKGNCVVGSYSYFYPTLPAAWSEVMGAFDPSGILVVSNSADMRNDAAQLHAEPISYHLCAPVLLSATLKPSYPCASAALASLTPHELVVSDRIFTDVVLACRLS
ncbi:hypothetical protein BC827DRAFT_1110970, partial [Russula dissimulans]